MGSAPNLKFDALVEARTEEIFDDQSSTLWRQVDRVFASLMIFQWLAGIVWALLVSPKSWSGSTFQTHIHVWAAVFLGGVICSLPVALAIFRPGRKSTRHIIAVGQMLASALLIHISGGRIETHFHIFGSLAFLAFYRDWPVLLSATAVIIADHIFRGLYFPESVYGVIAASPWRGLEHAGWIVFEDVFLAYSCVRGRRELYGTCQRQASLEITKASVEQLVVDRTAELAASMTELDQRRMQSIASSRLASLGEMAGGMAHEINTPLAVIKLRAHQLARLVTQPSYDHNKVMAMAQAIESTTDLIGKIVQGLRSFSRNSEADPMTKEAVKTIISNTLGLCNQRFAFRGIKLEVDDALPAEINCRPAQISQVLVNLLSNAADAIESQQEKWINVAVGTQGDIVEIRVTDSGQGIDPDVERKLFHPFFTTKPIGQGTGLGLSISKGIIENHGGTLEIDHRIKNTCFLIRLPKIAAHADIVA